MENVTQKTGNTLSSSLQNDLLQKNLSDAERAPRAAARGTALRAVKVLTSFQILPEPLDATAQVATSSTASGFRGGITGTQQNPCLKCQNSSWILHLHFLYGSEGS